VDPFEYLLSLERFGIKFGLQNIQTLIGALNHPDHAFRSVLIAGTNGKGSVTAMVDRALRSAGVRVGRYTSPHLIRLEERFAVNGETIPAGTLADLIDQLRRVVDTLLATGALEHPPTFFEVTTALALEWFRRARVELAVLEVGLGGRLDATNVVDPVAAAITSIDFDHEQYLGRTLAAIAGEKAGVVRPGIPIVIGPMTPEARGAIAEACARVGAELVEADRGAVVQTTAQGGRTSMRLATPAREYGWIPLGMRGEHQATNAVVAVRLLERLEGIFPVVPEAIIAGLRDVRWPGRLQMIANQEGKMVLLDAAHNPAGAWTLAAYLRREFPEPIPIVFGAMRDKDVALMLKTLLPVAARLVATQPRMARAMPAAEVAAIARRLAPGAPIEIEPEPRVALARAWTHCPVVCAAGSIFLVGALLDELGPSAREL
jgi:dihydrofolate synthase/folylpolyglutamate synthase